MPKKGQLSRELKIFSEGHIDFNVIFSTTGRPAGHDDDWFELPFAEQRRPTGSHSVTLPNPWMQQFRNGVTNLAVCNASIVVAYFWLDREHIGAVADAVPVDSELVEDCQQQV